MNRRIQGFEKLAPIQKRRVFDVGVASVSVENQDLGWAVALLDNGALREAFFGVAPEHLTLFGIDPRAFRQKSRQTIPPRLMGNGIDIALMLKSLDSGIAIFDAIGWAKE